MVDHQVDIDAGLGYHLAHPALLSMAVDLRPAMRSAPSRAVAPSGKR